MAFQITAFGILLAFYGCYFLKMMGQRRRGIRTDQLGKGKTGVKKAIEIIVKTAAYLVLAAEVVSILRKTTAFSAPLRWAGAYMGIAGVMVFVISVLAMRDNWRAGVSSDGQSELVTTGIYQISRNPAFLGFYLVYTGILLMFFNWPLFLLSGFAVLMLHLQVVRVEETFLAETFGGEYAAYRKKVLRYFGRRR